MPKGHIEVTSPELRFLGVLPNEVTFSAMGAHLKKSLIVKTFISAYCAATHKVLI